MASFTEETQQTVNWTFNIDSASELFDVLTAGAQALGYPVPNFIDDSASDTIELIEVDPNTGAPTTITNQDGNKTYRIEASDTSTS